MHPTLRGGDLIITRRADGYAAGDVVAFRVPAGQPGEGQLVIHRIIGGDASGFTTQGDNRELPDLWSPTAKDVLGRRWIRAPGLGRVLYVIRSPLVIATIAGCVAFLIVLTSRPRDPTGATPRSAARRHQWPAGTASAQLGPQPRSAFRGTRSS